MLVGAFTSTSMVPPRRSNSSLSTVKESGLQRALRMGEGKGGLEAESVLGMFWDNGVGIERKGAGMVKGSGGDGPDVKDSCVVM